MISKTSRLLLLATFALSLLATRPAAAAPGLGYIDGAYALPWHVAFRTYANGSTRVNQTEYMRSGAALGAGALSGGIGLGYSGLNGQLDFRNALNLTTGALTIGWRQKATLGPIELWGRLGIGPVLAIDFANLSHPFALTGGVATDFEAGVDYFVLPWLALGVKGVATPIYSWVSNFSVDVALNVGLRLAI
jgi:hypothetical protein